jgi:cell division protein FtsZ
MADHGNIKYRFEDWQPKGREEAVNEKPVIPSPQTESSMNKIQWEEDSPSMTVIKVIGVGGGGCNAVDDMVTKGFSGVEFYAVNTDFQALKRNRVPNKIQIGEEITHGLGAGAIPELGEQAARAAEDQLRGILQGADMVFITAGMGGGTGTGAAPVIAEYARSMGILCVSIVTKPFTFEGPQRMRRAIQGIKHLKENVDTMIVIMNDKLMETVGPKTPLTEAFQVVNGVLAQGIRAISDLISMPGLINVDFRDVRTIMGETGGAVMGVGVGKGENRASEAVKKACHSPLQEKIVIDGARGVLINITGGSDITMHEINEATSLVYESADQDANIIFGVVIDDKMVDEMRVTIIATGFSEASESPVNPFSSMESHKIKSRQSVFSSPPPMAQDETNPSGIKEPDPIPAILRKRAGEMPASMPSIDFERHDNPLKDWDEPAKRGDQGAPQADGQGADEDRYKTPVFNDTPAADDQTELSGGDPYDIPALQRRRKQRFFE